MNIGRFAQNLVDSIADAGEKFIDLKMFRGSSTQFLLQLCTDLISHKGVASGLALAREVVNRYSVLSMAEKLTFLMEVNKKMGPNLEEIKVVATKYVKEPSEGNLEKLTQNIQSCRRKLFSRMIMAPNGTQAIVSLREDLLGFLQTNPELRAMDNDLKTLLTSWFNPGFLILKKIDWDTEASILEKIIEYEAVHDIGNWNDLKKRLMADRRCFAYFHPSLEDEPLIFVEVALTKGITGSIQSIISEDSNINDEGNTAIFYSINNCQRGLRKIPLGNFLIKTVVKEIASELPAIKKYSTLSPIPGFAVWLLNELSKQNSEFISEKEREILKIVNEKNWHADTKKCKRLKKPLVKACANYLLNVKKFEKPINSVAKFHFGNGAQLYRINWMGNTSAHGISESFGLMVNYLYDLKQIESNHEAYVQDGTLAISKTIRSVLK